MRLDTTRAEEAQQQGAQPIAVAVLDLVSQARNEHGMRHHEYDTYR